VRFAFLPKFKEVFRIAGAQTGGAVCGPAIAGCWAPKASSLPPKPHCPHAIPLTPGCNAILLMFTFTTEKFCLPFGSFATLVVASSFDLLMIVSPTPVI
jgi:hypothetical protein